ncbi:MAG: FkbM family methyltransferase [Patescibacteria group bacterium]
MEKKLGDLLSKTANHYKELILKNNPKFNFKKPVVLFGAAKLSPYFIKYFESKRTKILSLTDNDKSKIGKKLLGLTIISKKNLLKKFGKNIQIVVASVHYDEIIKELKKMGFNNVFNPMFFFTLDHKDFNLLTWRNNIDLIFKNKKKIKSAFALFKDEKSKKIYIEILRFRLAFDQSIFSKIKDDKTEYFDEKIIKLSPKEIFLDGGAYDGDTVKMFIEKSKNIFNKIYAFEPDDSNYIQLSKYINKLSDKRIISYKIGLGEKKEKLYFTNEGNLQSKITSKSKTLIKILPIDFLKDIIFTYIKLDIEGFEKQALLGAKKMISKFKPKLAVCLYHNIEDLWDVPCLINTINKNYKFYIRHYTNFLFDTICYAV